MQKDSVTMKDKVRRDGHVHTPYCPHGTKDAIESYIEKAIAEGLEEITFTEHMPLPDNILSYELQKECGLNPEDVVPYFRKVDEMKEKYKNKLKINKGLEVDYIEGYEEETKKLLDLYGEDLEDGLLSVHILKITGKYHCVDISAEEFGELAELACGIEKLYDLYFETLLKAIRADLGHFKPKRIGHPTLIRIFNLRYPLDYKNEKLLEEVVKELKAANYQIDFNTAGLRKPLCKEIYPSGIFLELIKKYEVEMIYGSDAHTAKDVASAFK